ncbi:conserved hypothetical protein [Vibrio chagasii]|nr:conserved hypothetical protein [Vibrio chagasii]
MQVKFFDVGGSNARWTAQVEEINYENLYNEVKRSGAILSSDIEFSYDDESGKGVIIVGLVRTVGKFEVTKANP